MTFTSLVPKFGRRAAIAAAVLVFAGASQAQGWPDKPIKLIAPSTPGGPPDLYARALGEEMAKALGQPVVVENMPAAGGMIGAQAILRAPADGHTLLVTTAGMMTITPNANPRAQYRGGDFAQICQGVETSLVLASNPSIGAKDFAGLSQWIKAQKPAPAYSSYSAGSPAHFLGHQLGEALKVDMTHVPYKSSPPQITDMIGGVSPMGFVQVSTALAHIQAGKIVPYAVTSAKRSPLLPQVPTVAEVGLPQLTATVWFGFAGPKGLPQPVVQKLTALHEKVLAMPAFQARMATAGLSVSPGLCGDAFVRKIESETANWGRVVKATGFVAD